MENLVDLEFLDLNSCNLISSIDVSNNIKLVELRASYNKLSSIDLTLNNDIKHLYLSGNELNEIDLSNLENLETLFINQNALENISLDNNKALKKLHICCNDLQGTVDVSMIDNLVELEIEGNSNLNCIKVNQNQLDDLMVNWKVPDNVTVSLDCN